MKKYNLTLTIKSLLFLFFTIFAVIFIDYLSLESSKRYLLKRELEYLRIVADARGAELLIFLDSRRQRMQDLASEGFIIEETRKIVLGKKDGSALTHYLVDRKMPLFKNIYQLLILSPDGRVIASTNGSLIGKDESREEYFTNAQKDIFMTEKENGYSGTPELVFTSLIYDPETHSPIGILSGFIPISKLERVLKGEFATELMEVKAERPELEAFEIVIINKDKLLLSASPFVKDSVLKKKADTLPARACLEKNEEVTEIFTDYRGVEVAGASICLPSLKWTMVYKVDKEVIFEPSTIVGRQSLRAVVLTILIIGILATFFIRLVVLQLKRLAKASGEMARGNYDITMPVRTKDELGALSESFNEMAGQIKARSEKLKESEERLRAILESMGNPVYIRGMEGKIVFMNRALLAASGLKRDEVLGKSVFDNFPWEIAEQINKTDLQAMESENPIEVEETIPFSSGARTFITIKFPLRDINGKKYAICGVATDITPIKKAKEALRKNEKSLRDAQRIAHIGNWDWDIVTNELRWSDEVYRIFGVNPQEFGASYDAFLSYVHPEDRRFVMRSVERALEGRPYSIDHRVITKDNRIMTVHEQGEVTFDESGRPIRMSGTVQDVTEMKKAEEEIRKLNEELEQRVEARTKELKKAISDLDAANREIETFTYSVAHDLRSPLLLIDGFSQLLSKKQKDRLDISAQDHLFRIREAAKRMEQLIDDLLNLSVAMRAEIKFETTDISAMADSIFLELKTANPDRAVEFRIEKGLMAKADKKLIRMMLENLIGNAWKYTSKKPEQRIEFGFAGKKDGREVFFIKDNGAGFDMKDSDKIFEPFSRLHSSREFPGTGVGLATVRRIMQRHGQEIWAEGEPGVGAVFYFTLETEA